MAPRRLNSAQDGPKIVPCWLQDASGFLQDGPKSLQDSPKTAQDASRWLQDGLIWHQYAPRQPIWAQDGPKIVPRWLQDGPKTAQDGPKRPQDGPEAPKRSPEMPQDEPRRLKRPQNSQSNARTVDGSSVHSRHRLRRPGRIIFAQYSSYQYPPVTLTAKNFL